MSKTKAVDPAKAQKKLLVTAIKKTVSVNTVIAILEDVLFTPDAAIVSDLETYVKIPWKLPGVPETGVCVPARMFIDILDMGDINECNVDQNFGIEFIDGKRRTKIMGENPDHYPKYPEGDFEEAGTLSKEDIERVKIALGYVSNDDLRPAMTGVLFGEELCATDAHRLYHHKLGFKKEFIVPKRTINILLSLDGDQWQVTYKETEKVKEVKFLRADGVEVISRVIDARFPDWKVVVPDKKDEIAKVFLPPDMMIKEVSNALKFSNKSTNMVMITLNGKASIHSCDVDFSYEYNNDLDFVEFGFDKKYKQFIIPAYDEFEERRVLFIKKSDGKALVRLVEGGDNFHVEEDKLLPAGDKKLSIAFNGKFLLEVLQNAPADAATKISLWGSTKAAIINDDFLVMPLMLNC